AEFCRYEVDHCDRALNDVGTYCTTPVGDKATGGRIGDRSTIVCESVDVFIERPHLEITVGILLRAGLEAPVLCLRLEFEESVAHDVVFLVPDVLETDDGPEPCFVTERVAGGRAASDALVGFTVEIVGVDPSKLGFVNGHPSETLELRPGVRR